jgi:hypothetical protein
MRTQNTSKSWESSTNADVTQLAVMPSTAVHGFRDCQVECARIDVTMECHRPLNSRTGPGRLRRTAGNAFAAFDNKRRMAGYGREVEYTSTAHSEYRLRLNVEQRKRSRVASPSPSPGQVPRAGLNMKRGNSVGGSWVGDCCFLQESKYQKLGLAWRSLRTCEVSCGWSMMS